MNTHYLVALAVLSALFACDNDDHNNNNLDASIDVADAGVIKLQRVTQTNLFADTAQGGAMNVDPHLVNPWGLAFNPNGIAWVANNGTGTLTLYPENSNTPNPLVVTVPPPPGAQGPSAPTGQVFNSTTGFLGDVFIVATEDGTIAGWQPAAGTNAVIRVDKSASGAVYKGIAIVPTNPPFLLATNFNAGKLDIFSATYNPVDPLPFVDPNVPAGFAPFNVAAIEDKVIVTYAMQDAQKHDDVAGIGHGVISVFDQAGNVKRTLVVGGVLNSPWGLAEVKNGFGGLPNGTLIVGNFGDGTVHAFDMNSGEMLATFATTNNAPLVIDGLWSLQFGVDNPGAGITGQTQRLYFTAGPNQEKNGLFGFLTAQ